jgi:two-component system copper resistance phosphate regulon response regulator CusR
MSGEASVARKAVVLVVEDEPKVARALRNGLQGEGYEVLLAANGEEGFYLASSRALDVIVLDVVLPGRDGFEILSALRAKGLRTPIIMLTARDSVEDRVQGLDRGADDYLVKPFAFPELLARLRVLLRGGQDQPLTLVAADLQLDLLAHRAVRAGQPLDLTRREFELLAYLVRHKGRLVSREMLARDVWRETARGTPLDNVIDVHIAHLRKKVDHGAAAKLIHTVRGVGFMIGETGTA